nr:winged helix-turn-helix domain-containing protein [Ornithinimicrobium sp. F0845]
MRLLPDGALVAETEVSLTPLEHAMLQCLLSPPGSVWSLLALSERVWGTSFVGDGSQVRAVLKRLRRKLLAAGADLQIESVRGRGLRVATGSGWSTPATAPQLPQ